MTNIRKITLIVGICYFALSAFMFRGVIASIPSVLRGEAVINADELVPFFNVHSQLLDQAAGKFNQLTNGYEFRVRYAFLTTWVRYYKVLPFAIVTVIPGITYLSYLVTAAFLTRVLVQYKPEKIYILTATPVLTIFLIMEYSKITHFYTLILGFALFLVAAILMTDGVIFRQPKQYKPVIIACLVTLFNPAVHYLVLFGLYMALMVVTLILMDAIEVFKDGSWRNILRWQAWIYGLRLIFKDWKRLFIEVRFWRCIGSFVMLAVFTLAPYGAFVKFYALKGVANLSETVPADYYFIQDASISLDHVVAFDMAGIMDKELTGDYLSKTPRYANILYTIMMFLPLFWKRPRNEIFTTPALRAFATVTYANTIFAMWATLGYSKPSWGPTFHRTIAFISNFADSMHSSVGDLVTKLLATVVQVLRFPHRFELIQFMLACILFPIVFIWLFETVQAEITARYARRSLASLAAQSINTRQATQRSKQQRYWLTLVAAALLFLVPLLSSYEYRLVFFSGNFDNFLTPYPVLPLKQVKEYLLKLPPGKVVVLPPTETAKTIVDINGVDHKFIDKFHIYYLDLPSFYYGLTGDSNNKHEFFLLLRAMYYEQGWWVNVARDLDLRYIIINKELMANPVGGQEYLREVERIIMPELARRKEFVRKLFENESFALYEFYDLPTAERIPLYIDTDWGTFIKILTKHPDLTRYYDLRYPMVVNDLEKFDRMVVISSDIPDTKLNMYLKGHPTQFARPDSTIIAFNPDLISSSYYLSPMFRLFQFFSDSKYNRLNMITPGLWGTIQGGFLGVPRPTQFRFSIKLPESGEYHLLMRGAASMNDLRINSKIFSEAHNIVLNSKTANLGFFDKRSVFTSQRVNLDPSSYSISELGRLIPTDIVVINAKYQFLDLGTITGNKGSYTFYFDKRDSNPLLIEGILVIPEEEYQTLEFPANVQVIEEKDLCCGSKVIEGQTP